MIPAATAAPEPRRIAPAFLRRTRGLSLLVIAALALTASYRPDRPAAATTPEPLSSTRPADGAPTEGNPAELRVRVIDVRNRKGTLIFGVFRQPDGFPSNENSAIAWQRRKADADAAKTGSADAAHEFVVWLPPGRYAATVLHDENDNGKMDMNFMGIPREGYGVTNNPKPRFRGATFDEAAFELPADGKTVAISLQYF
jgi:uncharacterized protein (DUF2141 family)